MSREMKVNDSPNHFMVLDAIGRGLKTADKISTVTKLDKTEVELILNDLAVQRLVNRMEKRGFLRSKIEFTINETGHDLLNSKKRELEQKTNNLKQAYGNGNTAQFQSFVGTDRAWIPFLLFSGLLDVLFFASAMSFLGLAMSPQESSMAGDAGGASESASESASDSTSDSNTAGQEDSGAADSGSSGGGDFQGGGFDSSGGSGMDFGGDFNF
ncbi:MAG: MarR family transcriptional regulator [Nitrososphaeraceae archaeon]